MSIQAGQHKVVLKHVVTTVFHLEPNNEIWRALINDVWIEEWLDIYQLIRLSPDEIATLEYKPKDTSIKLAPLPRALAALITNFQLMYDENIQKDKDYGNKILSITADEFDVFQNSLQV